ncbi:MAG: hypothetical protein KGJ23_07825 [Euryarchaeota archaeon]|nr:hypothetical protein [Euryarchaeota archaeon]MDE1836508.1 hypothetical protein [Euryarchaeota archaeon]MDE1879297.1 hypothetical protein [Euryarchaeota archaeon]MDE2044478.1 hypothetical protein [Thermoplasmata archaeon]
MSAYVVSKAHIDFLVQAGLDLAERVAGGVSPLRWYVTEPKLSTDYKRGQPWGPTAQAHARSRERELTLETADRVGEMLFKENEKSFDHCYDGRYKEDLEREPYKFERREEFIGAIWRVDPTQNGRVLPKAGDEGWRYSKTKLTPLAVLSALSGYQYQACEHPEWEVSEAHAFCMKLTRRCISILTEGQTWAVYGMEDVEGGVEDAGEKTRPRFFRSAATA